MRIRAYTKPKSGYTQGRLIDFQLYLQNLGHWLGQRQMAEFRFRLLGDGNQVSAVAMVGCSLHGEILASLAGRAPTPAEIQNPSLLIGRMCHIEIRYLAGIASVVAAQPP